MSNRWRKNYNFEDSPYQTTALGPTAEDADLFTGRERESISLLSQMDTTDRGVVVVSGGIGIGKSSFVNVEQYRISTGKAFQSPDLVIARVLTVTKERDDEVSLARKSVSTTLKNIVVEFEGRHIALPKQLKALEKWLLHEARGTGFSIGLQILGVGGHIARSISLPPACDTTMEGWQDVLSVIASECIHKLEVVGIIVCLDDVESVGFETLTRLLRTYRDTLFMTKGVWWILMGKSHLYNRLDAHDRSISQRISGSGVEIPPMTDEELYDLTERRIRRYRTDPDAVSPLSPKIHGHIVRASRGVARFVLDTSEMLVGKFDEEIRASVAGELDDGRVAPHIIDKILSEKIAEILFEGRIPDEITERMLALMSAEMVKGKVLSRGDVDKLAAIGAREVQEEQFAEFDMESAEVFRQSFLERMREVGLLQSRSRQGRNQYRLENFAHLCLDLGAFDQVKALLDAGE